MQEIEFGFDNGSINDVVQLVRNSLIDNKEYSRGNSTYFTTYIDGKEITTIVENKSKTVNNYLYVRITSSCMHTLTKIFNIIRSLQLHSSLHIIK